MRKKNKKWIMKSLFLFWVLFFFPIDFVKAQVSPPFQTELTPSISHNGLHSDQKSSWYNQEINDFPCFYQGENSILRAEPGGQYGGDNLRETPVKDAVIIIILLLCMYTVRVTESPNIKNVLHKIRNKS